MKIRNGYVSNSSSSSFCIVGLEFNKSDYSSEEFISMAENAIQQGVYELWKLDDIISPLVIRKYDDEEMYFIGNPIENMEENETRKEFFEKTYEYFKNLGFISNKKLNIIKGSYRC